MNSSETNTLELELDIINILKSKNFTEAEAVEVVKKLEKIYEQKINASETTDISTIQPDFVASIEIFEQRIKDKLYQTKIDILKRVFPFFVVLLLVIVVWIFLK